MKVGIVGGGKAGTIFLKSLLDIKDVEIVGIMDINPEAPGLKLASQHKIPTFTDLKVFLQSDMDIVLELTGNQSVKDNIMKNKKEKTHVMDSQAAMLASLMSDHQQSLNEKLQQYISHIETLLKHIACNISELNDTAKSIEETSRRIINSVSNSIESIKKTDNIIKIINDITNRIKILGINASIEAARAGEHGSGFKVVADEIGKLTASSKNATSDITAIIENMKSDIGNLSEITRTLDEICKKQIEIAAALEDRNRKMENVLING